MTFANVPELPQLVTQLGQAGVAIADLDAVDQAAGQVIADASQPFIPRATGQLAAAQRGLVNATHYAAPVHWGWVRGNHREPATPWLVKGADAVADSRVADLYEEHIDNELRTI